MNNQEIHEYVEMVKNGQIPEYHPTYPEGTTPIGGLLVTKFR